MTAPYMMTNVINPRRALNDVMEFDHVIRVHDDGTITDSESGFYAPESYITTDADGSIRDSDEADWRAGIERAGWHILNGYSGQSGYPGPIMHQSEYIGGDMLRTVLDTPAYWTAVSVETFSDDSDDDSGFESEPAGWAILYRDVPAGVDKPYDFEYME